ncbi:hypothetical protein [Actinoplanes sp. G11-F43]|uniref:hypothetical protein n=1 Tax=Actinoplanes sp. G11-F43 TaxID=3424130 RepID=UPI003D336E6C
MQRSAMNHLFYNLVRRREGQPDATVRGRINSTRHAFLAPDADVQAGDQLVDDERMKAAFLISRVTPQMGYSQIDHLKVSLRQPPRPRARRTP